MCCYGIDFSTRAELIGADLGEQEICDFVGADSLHYISLDGLISATPNVRDGLCTACFTGDYPIPVPGEHQQLAQVKFDFGRAGHDRRGQLNPTAPKSPDVLRGPTRARDCW